MAWSKRKAKRAAWKRLDRYGWYSLIDETAGQVLMTVRGCEPLPDFIERLKTLTGGRAVKISIGDIGKPEKSDKGK